MEIEIIARVLNGSSIEIQPTKHPIVGRKQLFFLPRLWSRLNVNDVPIESKSVNGAVAAEAVALPLSAAARPRPAGCTPPGRRPRRGQLPALCRVIGSGRVAWLPARRPASPAGAGRGGLSETALGSLPPPRPTSRPGCGPSGTPGDRLRGMRFASGLNYPACLPGQAGPGAAWRRMTSRSRWPCRQCRRAAGIFDTPNAARAALRAQTLF